MVYRLLRMVGRMSRWSFPNARRDPGKRPHSLFSCSFTYEWVARVGLEATEKEPRSVGLEEVPKECLRT